MRVKPPSDPGVMVTDSENGRLSVGEIRNAIAYLDDNVEVVFSDGFDFYRFKMLGDDTLMFDLSEKTT